MSDFKARMYQIQFRLELRPRPSLGAYSAPPDPIAVLRKHTSKGERRGRERKGRGRGGKGKGRGRKGEGTGTRPHHFTPPNPYFWICPCWQKISVNLAMKIKYVILNFNHSVH